MSIRTGQISRQAPQYWRAAARRTGPGRAGRASGLLDRTGVDRPMRVPADTLIHGADVQARAAADAIQDLGKLRPEEFRAVVVDHDHMHFVRPVSLGFVLGREDRAAAGRSRRSSTDSFWPVALDASSCSITPRSRIVGAMRSIPRSAT